MNSFFWRKRFDQVLGLFLSNTQQDMYGVNFELSYLQRQLLFEEKWS